MISDERNRSQYQFNYRELELLTVVIKLGDFSIDLLLFEVADSHSMATNDSCLLFGLVLFHFLSLHEGEGLSCLEYFDSMAVLRLP